MYSFATQTHPSGQQMQQWTDAVCDVLFPMYASCQEPAFNGLMRSWDVGKGRVAHFRSGPVTYRRERHHVAHNTAEDLLISIAVSNDLVFSQYGATLDCPRHHFVVQRGRDPYEFQQLSDNDVLVLKVPAAMLETRLPSLERLSSHVFSAKTGAGGLFFDTLRSLPKRVTEFDGSSLDAVLSCLIEFLAIALEGNPSLRDSQLSSVRQAHLIRAQRFIRQNLAAPSLSPEAIAHACGISVRYLHQIFSTERQSVGHFIREQRLLACEKQLRSSARKESIAEVALRWGFGDQAQFCRHFKAHFGRTAKQFRAEVRAARATGAG